MVPSSRYHASASRVCTCSGLPAPGGCVTSEAASSPAVSPAPTRRSNNAPIAQVAAPEPAATASGAAPVLVVVVVSEAVGVWDTRITPSPEALSDESRIPRCDHAVKGLGVALDRLGNSVLWSPRSSDKSSDEIEDYETSERPS